MESEASRRLIDALPGLVWTGLPDGNADFVNYRRLEYAGLTAGKRAERVGNLRSTRRMARSCSDSGCLGTLTGSIAHEVCQPLSGILTSAGACFRMLAGDPPNVPGASETVRRIVRDSNRAAEVIARLRALFAKREARTETVDLNEVTKEVLTLPTGELQRNLHRRDPAVR